MLVRQALHQSGFSLSALMVPGSTTARNNADNDEFSSSTALSGTPIKFEHVQAQGVVNHGLAVLQKNQNPALLTIRRNRLRTTTCHTSVVDTPSFHTHVLYTLLEEDLYIQNLSSPARAAELSTRSLATSTKALISSRTCSSHSVHFSRRATQQRSHHGTELSKTCVPLRSTNCTYFGHHSIMPVIASAPGTPPELTDSQSSASSCTSRHSSPDDFSGGSMNFEEIHLDDEDHQVQNEKSQRKTQTPYTSPTKSIVAHRPALATLQTQQTKSNNSSERFVKSATLPLSRRNFTSPTISVASTQKNPSTRSGLTATYKPTPAARLAQFAQTPPSSLTVPGRRKSWQPARKTIYEIEAEYHDSDDELPEHASLFNVPMSPCAGGPRTAPLSARSSAHGSPERDSPALSPAPIPLDHSRSVPDVLVKVRGKSRLMPHQRPVPRSSSHRQTGKAKSASTSPHEDLRYGRSKSWNLVMADLSHEARVIAEKLDFHHEGQSKVGAVAATSHRVSAPGAIPLPPIQRGTLDFMPTSKEKEAVLSRTRPSWLPPKNPREEQRHLQEYKRMMLASVEADRRRQEKFEQQHCTNDTTRDSLQRIWTYYVEPSTDLGNIDNRVDGLSWRGIPPKLRGAVWQRKIGNGLGLTAKTYSDALQRITAIKSKPADQADKHERFLQKCFADIERDAETAFPDINIFRKQGPQWQDLINVCEVYTIYRADVGYSYGMQLVAALVLLQVPDPCDAFILVANCLAKAMPKAFQVGDESVTTLTYGKLKSALNIKFPRLYAYLFEDQEAGGLGFTGNELFEPMFRTIFANGLDLDRLCRLWDIWIFENDRYLTRAAVALLGLLQTQIFEIQGDIHLRRRNIQELLGWGPFNRTDGGYWNLAAFGNGDSFVQDVRSAGNLDSVGV